MELLGTDDMLKLDVAKLTGRVGTGRVNWVAGKTGHF